MEEGMHKSVVTALWLIAFLASSAHVFVQSKRDRRVGFPIRHTLMVALVVWPISYLCWVLWWPGSLRQWLLGSDEERIKKVTARRFGRKESPNKSSEATP